MPSDADAVGGPTPGRGLRVEAIDRLRGLVVVLMLVDHTREFFYFGHQVSDPMDLTVSSPALVATRLVAHLCAPIFVALTGLAAWLYGANRSRRDVSGFLLRRGAFLMLLELTVVNFAWTFKLPPETIFLQVIWAIGLSMIALAGLVWLPRAAIAAIGIAIVAGHNLLDPLHFAAGTPGHTVWAVLHDRGYLDLGLGVRARTSYPVLPWIGVIALGFAIGPWFAVGMTRVRRRVNLTMSATLMFVAFAVLRSLNGYGEPVAWTPQPSGLLTALGFFNLTKYPPSLDFLLVTLGIGTALLIVFGEGRGRVLAVFGGAPLFFYVVHLYVLHALHMTAGWAVGRSDYEAASVGELWLIAAAVAVPLWFATRWFGGIKRTSPRWWIRYL